MPAGGATQFSIFLCEILNEVLVDIYGYSPFRIGTATLGNSSDVESSPCDSGESELRSFGKLEQDPDDARL